MKTLRCKCENQGLLLIGVDYFKNEDATVPSYESGLAHYEFKTPESLLNVAKEYKSIKRSNGNIEKGSAYTIRKAKNDFNSLAKERELKKEEALNGYRISEVITDVPIYVENSVSFGNVQNTPYKKHIGDIESFINTNEVSYFNREGEGKPTLFKGYDMYGNLLIYVM